MAATVEGGDPGASDRPVANGAGRGVRRAQTDHTDPDPDHEPEPDGQVDAVEFDAGHDLSTRVANARARHGRAGGMLAAGMLGLDQAMTGRKPREQAPVVVDANSDPHDIDTDGISVALDDVDVVAPPLPRTPPVQHPGKRRRWR